MEAGAGRFQMLRCVDSLSPLPEPGGPGGDTPGTELPGTGDEIRAQGRDGTRARGQDPGTN
ncbi:hypothetical protein E2562_030831 [Oryza meyeriana var. granulata]|uniref:Uncharacterized protein n=1 Tax=Oryza meyeriana var. granulata TaxID=110450 RepID=A0A6G1EZX6_9ORYZ|nr:hypothetical protein E2562_030831 [Oryza meyeriana var. granulata]